MIQYRESYRKGEAAGGAQNETARRHLSMSRAASSFAPMRHRRQSEPQGVATGEGTRAGLEPAHRRDCAIPWSGTTAWRLYHLPTSPVRPRRKPRGRPDPARGIEPLASHHHHYRVTLRRLRASGPWWACSPETLMQGSCQVPSFTRPGGGTERPTDASGVVSLLAPRNPRPSPPAGATRSASSMSRWVIGGNHIRAQAQVKAKRNRPPRGTTGRAARGVRRLTGFSS